MKEYKVKKFFDFTDNEFRNAYIEESLIANTQADVCLLLKNKSVSKAELARRLGVSAPHVSQMLGDEDANLTLRTIARIYAALDEEVSICAKQRLVGVAPETKSALPPSRGIDCWSGVSSGDPWEKSVEVDTKQSDFPDQASAVVWFEKFKKAA